MTSGYNTPDITMDHQGRVVKDRQQTGAFQTMNSLMSSSD